MTQKIQLPSTIFWTKHSREKMKHYRLSEARVKRVLWHPDRVEKGIAPGTVAKMQIAGSKKHPSEIWVMYQENFTGACLKKERLLNPPKKRIISAWRYPGQSPIGEKIKIPEEVLQDLKALGLLS
jgi:hypothetical protein